MADQPSLPSLPSLSDAGGSVVDFNNNVVNPGVQSAYGDYATAAKGMAKPLDIYNNLENSAGIPALRKTSSSLQGQVNDLTDAIGAVEGNVNSTTQNSLVTEGQRNNMIVAQKAPLQKTLSPLATSLGRTQQSIQDQEAGINTKVGYAVQGNQQDLDVYKTKLSLANDNAARMMTGFTADREANMSLLMAKYNAGVQLTMEQMRELSDSSIAANNFDKQKQLLNMQTQADIEKQNNTYKSMSKYGLYNPATGAVVGGSGSGSSNTSLFGGSSGETGWG